MNGLAESSERILELEKDNKKYEMTLKQLEVLRAKDAEYMSDLEKQLGQTETKKAQADEVAAALKESGEQLRIEKETEIENLVKQVDSLRRRQEQNQNEQQRLLEEENRKLVKVRKLRFLGTAISRRSTFFSELALKTAKEETERLEQNLRALLRRS